MVNRIISTLCPKRLPRADFVSLAGRVQPRLTLPRFGTIQIIYGRDPDAATSRFKPFPLDADGFLYYYTPPKAPPYFGEIRFRVASDPDSFHNGKDLLSLDKIPWSLSLYTLANRGGHSVLRNQLIHDGLVSRTVLKRWTIDQLRSGSRGSGRRCPGAMLYYLHQPFFHRFDKYHVSFYAITKENISFGYPVNFTRVVCGGRSVAPYSGELLPSLHISHFHDNSAQEAPWFDSNVTVGKSWPCAFSKYWNQCRIRTATMTVSFAVLRKGN